MDIAEDRGRFSDMLKELGIPYPITALLIILMKLLK
jgi:carbamoylphosphate synthase large subunit